MKNKTQKKMKEGKKNLCPAQRGEHFSLKTAKLVELPSGDTPDVLTQPELKIRPLEIIKNNKKKIALDATD